MRIFNKEIKNCANCDYHNFTKNGNDCTFNRKLNFIGVEGIHADCDFSKKVSKEDIKSLGFESTLNPNYFEKLTKNDLFTLTVNKDKTYSLENKKFMSYPMFDHITAESKPHLEFILNSVGFGCS